MLVAFAVIEVRQAGSALVPRDVLRNRTFAGASLAVLLMSAIFFSALLYLPAVHDERSSATRRCGRAPGC